MSFQSPKRQQGVALIFVMLIFVMVTVMASRIITDLHFNTEKTARQLQYQQAHHYAMGAEQFVAMLLEEDFQRDKQSKKPKDHWFEPWAEQDQPLDTEEGEITIMTLDDQGRFNLNMLASHGKEDKPDKDKLEMLIRLLASQNIDAQVAYRLQDWVDSNQDPLPGGAEDNTYLLLTPPYRTSDSALASVSELRLLDVLTPEEFDKLVPLVSVLPSGDGININTATAGVLRSLSERISETDAKGFVDGRSKDGFADMKEVTNHPLLKNKISKKAESLITLNSSYFSVYVKAQYRDMTFYQHSRLARDKEGKVRVISREMGVFPGWVKTLRESVR
ncbi:type II secretion system minor pseudopilin GspK [Parendozoicomonas haliclonae]|uniref:Type II secretion system protein K n=1 Tax=Parendozoicomonas haliclonae TaxID=1960125 RepID=A0A1X7AMQ5_9GAMM|nr:type II secretion system minor pseudopilin GspK [Parendozoicomonas haliclonae]SMA49290.1 putative type II secretion system protein K [Parendozoicomonas haliclonae]